MPRRYYSILALWLAFVTASHVDSAEKAGDQSVQIENLVVQLGDKNFRARQAAGRALEDFGEEALTRLRTALKDEDEEVRRRAEILVHRIERAALLSAKRVTLKMKNASVEAVVKELSRQTGYKVQFQGGQPRRITIDMENVAYWRALEKICNDAQLSPGFDEQRGVVYLYQQNTVSPFTYHSGPFRLVAQSFNYSRFINLANIPVNRDPNNNPFENNLNFGFMIQSEPKTPILSISPPKLIKAEDENGISLLPRPQDDGQEFTSRYYDGMGLYRNFQHSTAIAMSRPGKDATQAKIIKGSVAVTLLSGTKPDVVIDKLTVGNKKITSVGNTAEIEVQDVAEQNKVWTITLLIKRQVRNGEPQDFNWINSVQQKLELYDANGRKFHSQGVSNFINNTATSVHATYQFAAPLDTKMGPATKLVLAEWLTMTHELEFEFKDLPLP